MDKGNVIERKKLINFHQFSNIKELNVPNKYCVLKIRNTFIYQGIFFLMDTFEINNMVFSILVLQGHQDLKNIELPKIIEKNLVKEVKGWLNRGSG